MKAQLEARNLEKKSEAEAVAKKLDGQTFVIIRQAGEGGQLYGSVSTRDIAGAMEAAGFNVSRNQIELNIPIKSIGMHKLNVELHGEVEVSITVNVARNADEAARQARGEDLTVSRTEEEEAQAQARVDAGKFFEAPQAEDEEAPAETSSAKAEAKPAQENKEKKEKKEKKAKKEKAAQ
jgi:large subunit ribosomal protein L9